MDGVGTLALVPDAGYAQEQPPEKPWTGRLSDGRVITKADLDKILNDHKLWIESYDKIRETSQSE